MIITSPPTANTIRRILTITDPTTRILIDDTRTNPVYCDYTGQTADIEVRVYGTDLYETLYVTAEDTIRAITDLTNDHDVDQVEVVVNLGWFMTLVEQVPHAA